MVSYSSPGMAQVVSNIQLWNMNNMKVSLKVHRHAGVLL